MSELENNIIRDAIGKEIQIGDRVAYSVGVDRSSKLKIGIVAEFTPPTRWNPNWWNLKITPDREMHRRSRTIEVKGWHASERIIVI